jgi:hypothetical protein
MAKEQKTVEQKTVEQKKVTIEEVRALFVTLHNAVLSLNDENLTKSMTVDAMAKGFRSKLLGEYQRKTSTEAKPFVPPLPIVTVKG